MNRRDLEVYTIEHLEQEIARRKGARVEKALEHLDQLDPMQFVECFNRSRFPDLGFILTKRRS